MNSHFLYEHTGGSLRDVLSKINSDELLTAREIRIRMDKPLLFYNEGGEKFITSGGKLTQLSHEAYRPNESDLRGTIEHMSNFSLYAIEDEIKNGFLTLPGGHRAGICGKAVIENGKLKTIKNFSSINLRISHEIKGCAEHIIDFIVKPDIKSSIIISPPGKGKTTILRDIVRLISDGFNGSSGVSVGISDERSEISGTYMGRTQNEVGKRTDVVDGCPKAQGMMLLLRSMSPRVIAVDEIGGEEDIAAISDISNAGISLICTMHGSSISDLLKKPMIASILSKKIFERFIVLGNKQKPGIVAGIYDENYKEIYCL